MINPTHVYEAVDCTNDEMYFPVGIWHSLEDAANACDGDEPPCDEQSGDDDRIVVEIRERAIGFSEHGKRVASFEWERDWDNDPLGVDWKRVQKEGGA